ncbi:Fic/DOC family protein [Pseudokineococcus sp. 1T1Z-3]|uniref:Fic/DOC family protein n=1 Tax=Pseudokineococcus sp. 1T1Z-3 TaxID=3132745 RepID=UPI0030B18B8A
MPSAEWESYFWPGTAVLRNRFGVRDGVELARLEYAATAVRRGELSRGEAQVEATFDAEHLRGLHRHLFRDVYDWAGEFRSVDMAKDGLPFAPTRLVGHYLAQTRDAVAGVNWARVDRAGFAHAMAAVYAPLNQAHPFREGNGRTGRAFLDDVAQSSPFRLDRSRVTPEVWNQRSAMSGPDQGYLLVHPQWLEPVFAQMTVERPAGAAGQAMTPEEQRLAGHYRSLRQGLGPVGGYRPPEPGRGGDEPAAGARRHYGRGLGNGAEDKGAGR